MIKISEMNIGELAAFICDYLNKNGIECTLTGGACVSIYSDNKYRSADLDFIEKISYPRKKIIDFMLKIGFVEKNRYFVNPETYWYVEFPTGPLSIGSEPVREIFEIKYPTGLLRIISPTECVKDRLAAYYFWDDLQAFEQAILVSSDNNINFNEIERWSEIENSLTKYLIFQSKITQMNQKK
jgi:hypothetical protein